MGGSFYSFHQTNKVSRGCYSSILCRLPPRTPFFSIYIISVQQTPTTFYYTHLIPGTQQTPRSIVFQRFFVVFCDPFCVHIVYDSSVHHILVLMYEYMFLFFFSKLGTGLLLPCLFSRTHVSECRCFSKKYTTVSVLSNPQCCWL